MDLRNMKVLVVGLGTSGFDACSLLEGAGAIVSATDNDDNAKIRRNRDLLRKRYIDVEIGGHTKEFLRDIGMVVASPGVRKEALPLKHAFSNNIPVIGELELGYQFCKGKIIAVTGTNGKSTVVTLLGDIFRKSGLKTVVCGNIGYSLSRAVQDADKDTICVTEVSSYQLERIIDFKPAISCILNITEDHLDRYRDLADYAKAKYKIFSNQKKGEAVVLNYDNPRLRNAKVPRGVKKLFYSKKNKIEGLYLSKGTFVYNLENKQQRLFKLPEMALKGLHNIENILATVLIAHIQGVELKKIEKALIECKPLQHRLESIDTIDGVEFLDDSKATNIDATNRALESVFKPIVLIAGGRDKGGDYRLVQDKIKSKVKKIILIGESAPLIYKALKESVEVQRADTLEEATFRAFEAANSGEAVLLSPMCSSFDMFRDYTHRAEVFRKAVESLRTETANSRQHT